MSVRIEGNAQIAPDIGDVAGVDKAGAVDGKSFGDELASAVGGTSDLLAKAGTQGDALAKGKGNLHEAAVTLEEADIATRFLVKARNKVVDAYQEIMRMPV